MRFSYSSNCSERNPSKNREFCVSRGSTYQHTNILPQLRPFFGALLWCYIADIRCVNKLFKPSLTFHPPQFYFCPPPQEGRWTAACARPRPLRSPWPARCPAPGTACSATGRRGPPAPRPAPVRTLRASR